AANSRTRPARAIAPARSNLAVMVGPPFPLLFYIQPFFHLLQSLFIHFVQHHRINTPSAIFVFYDHDGKREEPVVIDPDRSRRFWKISGVWLQDFRLCAQKVASLAKRLELRLGYTRPKRLRCHVIRFLVAVSVDVAHESAGNRNHRRTWAPAPTSPKGEQAQE